MKAPNIRKVLTAVGVVLLVFTALAIWFPAIMAPIQEIAFRWQAKKQLAAATTPEERESAVGDLGLYCPLRDGSWIAICYKDTHSGEIVSVAIALDSEGRFYECYEHFCGTFSIYRKVRESLEERREEELQSHAVHPVATAPDLEIARKHLLKMGFVQMD